MSCQMEQKEDLKLLDPVHKIYDAVHGFIRFNALEKWVIDSAPFQRLLSIHQLGIAYLVYPGATHTRFEHSLGTMHLATQIFERIVSKGFVLSHPQYWLQIVRLAALCHDLGHLPFSHDAEKVLLGPSGHEGWTYKMILHLEPIWKRIGELFPEREIGQDILKMAIGEKKLLEMGCPLPFSPLEQVLSQIVTADFFGADRIDYLLRDAKCTGVAHGFFDYHQLIEMLTVLPSEGTLRLGIEENGLESCEALLLARHFMHKRVYLYVTAQLYKFHLARFMTAHLKKIPWSESLEEYLSLTDNEILVAIRKASKDPSLEGHLDALALTDRSKRFRALPIEAEADAKILTSQLIALGIPPDAFFVEPPNSKGQAEFSFSLQTRSSKIAPAKEHATLSFHPKKQRWLFVSSDYEKSARLFFQASVS